MNRTLTTLTLLLTLSLCSCKDSARVGTVEDIDKLNAAAAVAKDIEKAFAVECQPYFKPEAGVAQIEVNVSDPTSDYESLVRKVSELQSVRSFGGELHLLFLAPDEPSNVGAAQSDRGKPLAKFDAKTGKRLPSPE